MDAIMNAGRRSNKKKPRQQKHKHLSKETFYIDDARNNPGLVQAISPGNTNGYLAGKFPINFLINGI